MFCPKNHSKEFLCPESERRTSCKKGRFRATLTSVAVVISPTGVWVCSPNAPFKLSLKFIESFFRIAYQFLAPRCLWSPRVGRKVFIKHVQISPNSQSINQVFLAYFWPVCRRLRTVFLVLTCTALQWLDSVVWYYRPTAVRNDVDVVLRRIAKIPFCQFVYNQHVPT